MGLFTRRRDRADDDAADVAPAGPDAAPAAATAQRAPEGAWETMPAIQRTVGPAPTTFRTGAVNTIMPTHQNPSLSGSMGHHISDDGPSGVVDGLTTTVGFADTPSSWGSGTEASMPLRQPDLPEANHHSEAAPSGPTWTVSVAEAPGAPESLAAAPTVAPSPPPDLTLAGTAVQRAPESPSSNGPISGNGHSLDDGHGHTEADFADAPLLTGETPMAAPTPAEHEAESTGPESVAQTMPLTLAAPPSLDTAQRAPDGPGPSPARVSPTTTPSSSAPSPSPAPVAPVASEAGAAPDEPPAAAPGSFDIWDYAVAPDLPLVAPSRPESPAADEPVAPPAETASEPAAPEAPVTDAPVIAGRPGPLASGSKRLGLGAPLEREVSVPATAVDMPLSSPVQRAPESTSSVSAAPPAGGPALADVGDASPRSLPAEREPEQNEPTLAERQPIGPSVDDAPTSFATEPGGESSGPRGYTEQPLLVMPTRPFEAPAMSGTMPQRAPDGPSGSASPAPAGTPTSSPAPSLITGPGVTSLPGLVRPDPFHYDHAESHLDDGSGNDGDTSATIATLATRTLEPSVQRAPAQDDVPANVQAMVERETGADLSGVRVHRHTGAQAASIQAKAFTVGGEVHLPDHHGPLDKGEGRNLLAHELTHVAQQRKLGGARPLEHTEGGQALEAQAQAMEKRASVASELDTPRAPQRAVEVHAPKTPEPMPMPLAAPAPRADAHPSPAVTIARLADPGQAAIDAGVAQRASDGSVVFTHTMPPAAAPEPTYNPPAGGGSDHHVQRAEAAAEPPEGGAAGGGGGGGGAGDDAALDEMAKKLYDKIRWRLRKELRVNLEQYGNGAGLQRL